MESAREEVSESADDGQPPALASEAAAPPAPEDAAAGPAPPPPAAAPPPTHADAAVAVAPHALGCIFFGLLLCRLEGTPLAWPLVFAPLFAADAVTFLRRFVDARQASTSLAAAPAVTGAALAAKHVDVLRPRAAAIDALGACCAKACIVLRLGAVVDWDVALLLLPFWAATVVSGLLRGRCFVLRRSVDREQRSMENDRRLRRHAGRPPSAEGDGLPGDTPNSWCEPVVQTCAFLQGALLHGVGRALQPALVAAKLDGALHARWGLVFAPAWALLAALAGVAATLCNCAPVLSAGMPPRVRRRAVRLVSLCATQLLVLSGCTFLCLLKLSKRLDSDEAARARYHDRYDRRHCDDFLRMRTVNATASYEALCSHLSKDGPTKPTPLDILGPLILMYALLFILHPIVLRDSRRFQRVVQIVVVDADDLEAQRRARGQGFDVFLGAPASLVGVQDNSVIIESLAAPTRLLKTSSTLYARMGASKTQIAHCAPAPAASWDDDCGSLGSSRFGDEYDDLAEAPAPSPSHLCYVCCVARKNAVIMECGHGGICFECGKSLASRHPRKCPICRGPISAVLRVATREPGSPHVFSPEGVAVQPRR
jgi:hypothetical protein